MDHDLIITSTAVLLLSAFALLRRRRQNHTVQKKTRLPRRFYVRRFYRNRDTNNEHTTLVEDLRANDPELHFQHFRMSKERYQHLLSLIETDITHSKNHIHPISADQRLSFTLTVLAEGLTQSSAARRYKISRTSANVILREVCSAIWKNLQPAYMPDPTEPDWLEAGKRFYQKWQFPNCVGAIDGKHVEITAPNKSGAMFHNYKEYFSMVLLASVDADYCFQVVDIGGYGRQSDGGTLMASEFGKALYGSQLNLPPATALPNSDKVLPHVFVGDSAFPLKENLMKPYPEKKISLLKMIFSYRLSRARRIVENAFGILVNRWSILKGPMQCEPITVELVVKAASVLHNYLIKTEKTAAIADRKYLTPGFADTFHDDGTVTGGGWRSGQDPAHSLFTQLSACSAHNHSAGNPMRIRDEFCEYFNTTGSVPWQDTMVHRH